MAEFDEIKRQIAEQMAGWVDMPSLDELGRPVQRRIVLRLHVNLTPEDRPIFRWGDGPSDDLREEGE